MFNPIGQQLDLDNQKYEIIGVLPAWFSGTSGNADLLTPILARSAESLNGAWSLEFAVVARLFTREGLVMSGAGVAIGLVGAFALTRSDPVEALR